MNDLELETFWSPNPIMAVKEYRFNIDKNVFISDRSSIHTIGVLETATCRNLPDWIKCDGNVPALFHSSSKIPDLKLSFTCGFHGFKEIDFLVKARNKFMVHFERTILLVELSGRIVEHEFGYRAQHQRIIKALTKLEVSNSTPIRELV